MQQARLSGADADSFVIVFAAMGVKNDIADYFKRSFVGIEVAGEPLAPGDLPLGGGELTQRLAVGGDVGHDDQHMHPPFEGEVFRNCQRTAGGEDTFDDRVVPDHAQRRYHPPGS